MSPLIDSRFVFLGLAFNALGVGYYLRNALKGQVQPHLVTWLLWALGPLLAFSAELSTGVGLQSLLTFVAGFNPALVFLVSLRNPEARWSISRVDLLCGALSVAGLALWIALREARLAIVLTIAADALAAVPTYRKSITHPESEAWLLYLCLAVSSAITIATIKTWTFATYGFPVYLAALGASLTAIILVRRGANLRSEAATGALS